MILVHRGICGRSGELFIRVYLKSRKFSLFLQAQLDFALNSLEIHKGFLRLFALNPACACEIFVIFFVSRYTLGIKATGIPMHPTPKTCKG